MARSLSCSGPSLSQPLPPPGLRCRAPMWIFNRTCPAACLISASGSLCCSAAVSIAVLLSVSSTPPAIPVPPFTSKFGSKYVPFLLFPKLQSSWTNHMSQIGSFVFVGCPYFVLFDLWAKKVELF